MVSVNSFFSMLPNYWLCTPNQFREVDFCKDNFIEKYKLFSNSSPKSHEKINPSPFLLSSSSNKKVVWHHDEFGYVPHCAAINWKAQSGNFKHSIIPSLLLFFCKELLTFLFTFLSITTDSWLLKFLQVVFDNYFSLVSFNLEEFPCLPQHHHYFDIPYYLNIFFLFFNAVSVIWCSAQVQGRTNQR